MQSNPVIQFFRAIGWGSLAGGGPFLLLTLPLGVGMMRDGIGEGLLIMALPLLIAAATTLAAMVAIGLPLTWFLHRSDRESRRTYTLFGAGLGFALPMIFSSLSGSAAAGLFLAIPGVLAGATSASLWGGWRQKRSFDHGAAEVFS